MPSQLFKAEQATTLVAGGGRTTAMMQLGVAWVLLRQALTSDMWVQCPEGAARVFVVHVE